jgi:hypothetical protein
MILYPSILPDVTRFDQIIKDLVAFGGLSMERQTATSAIRAIFTSSAAFGSILRTHFRKIGYGDLALTDETLRDLRVAVQRFPALFAPMAAELGSLALTFPLLPQPPTFWDLRSFLLFFAFAGLFPPAQFIEVLHPFLRHINVSLGHAHDIFFEFLIDCPQHLRHITTCLQTTVTWLCKNGRRRFFPPPEEIEAIAVFLLNLRDISSARSPQPLPSSSFSNEDFTRRFQVELPIENFDWHVQPFSAILTLRFKNDLFRHRTEITRMANAQDGLRREVARASRYYMTDDERLRASHFRLSVRRASLLEDTIAGIRDVPVEVLARPLMVSFPGEEGLDAGGISREFFHLLTARLFSPDYGMFKVLND